MLVVVDSHLANLTSVTAALDRLEAPYRVTDEKDVIRQATRVILPGVGAAPAAMRFFKKTGLDETLKSLTCPLLGICLGMQLLFTDSQESENDGQREPCLDLIKGSVEKLPAAENLPWPHMGWNTLDIKEPDHPLLRSVPDGAYMYFVHGFAATPGPYSKALCTYTTPFTAFAAQDNRMGCQFHPERSGPLGALVLRNFLKL